MKKVFPKTMLLRAASPLVLILLCVTGILRGGFSAMEFCADLIAASSLLLFYPLSFESVPKSFPYVAGQAAIYILLALSPVFKGNECLLITVSAIPAIVGYTIMRGRERYGNVKVLFRVDAIWCAVEDYARSVYILALGVLALAALTATASAITVEKVEPIRIHAGLTITDYGFASVKYGNYVLYGCYLDNSEADDAEYFDSCGYFTITNDSDYGANIRSIYVRGGSKYNWYWNWKDAYIPAHSSTTYYCSGHDSIRGFKGGWSVDQQTSNLYE